MAKPPGYPPHTPPGAKWNPARQAWMLAGIQVKGGSDPHPVGGNFGVGKILRGVRVISLGGMSTRQIQQYLKVHGYKVAVDGINGPQTQAAVAAFKSGVPASKWNAHGITPGGKPTSSSR